MQDETTPRETESPEQTADRSSSPGDDVEVPNGTYKIYTFLSNYKLVDMSLTENPNGVHNVKLYSDSNATESRWRIYTYSKNYEIRNDRDQGLRLARPVSHTDINVGAERTAQLDLRFAWSFLDVGGGHVEIRNEGSGKCLEVAGANTADNTNIILSYYDGLPQQKFRLVRM